MAGDVTVGRVGWWKAWRAAARNRARASSCFYCGAGFAPEGPSSRTVDHRVPRAAGGHDGLANLVFACLACNRRKADATEADFLASTWLAERRRDAQRGAP
jgi:5-methylcytosine-specific restriction endonuclease McrA